MKLFDTVMRFIDYLAVEANKMSIRADCPNIGLWRDMYVVYLPVNHAHMFVMSFKRVKIPQ